MTDVPFAVSGDASARPQYRHKAPRTCATARPQLAKADTAFQAHPLVNRLNLASPFGTAGLVAARSIVRP
jgi:hypothetical protein